ncbi:hypothetical protein BaRGS_00016419 [Batillaria attramentaria]|uniref:Galaxin-like repeats domain-containing protein n=1 Tax=Batillaria attramentaria TaxID=370345 RepID=A0ABD0KYT5_9CAEN
MNKRVTKGTTSCGTCISALFAVLVICFAGLPQAGALPTGKVPKLPPFPDMMTLGTPPSIDPRCRPGGDIASEGERIVSSGSKDDLTCLCGNRKKFRPSEQTCCDSMLYNISTSEATCCRGKAEPKYNHSCMGYCGETRFDRLTHQCCSGQVIQFKRIADSCCGTKSHGPYYPAAMTCTKTDGDDRVTLNSSLVFNSRDVCEKNLVNWGSEWPNIGTQSHMIHVSGLVQGCGIKHYSDHLTIPLVFTITRRQGKLQRTCLTHRNIRLVVMHERRQPCVSGREAKKFYRGKTMDIFVPESAFECNRSRPIVRLKDGDEAFVMFSNRFRAMYKESEGLPKKLYRG